MINYLFLRCRMLNLRYFESVQVVVLHWDAVSVGDVGLWIVGDLHRIEGRGRGGLEGPQLLPGGVCCGIPSRYFHHNAGAGVWPVIWQKLSPLWILHAECCHNAHKRQWFPINHLTTIKELTCIYFLPLLEFKANNLYETYSEQWFCHLIEFQQYL